MIKLSTRQTIGIMTWLFVMCVAGITIRRTNIVPNADIWSLLCLILAPFGALSVVLFQLRRTMIDAGATKVLPLYNWVVVFCAISLVTAAVPFLVPKGFLHDTTFYLMFGGMIAATIAMVVLRLRYANYTTAHQRGVCRDCGYNLHGLDTRPLTCPECGKVFDPDEPLL